MDKLLGNIKAQFRFDRTVIDNHIFRLHYVFTVIVLLTFSILVTSSQYIGDPIDCMSRDDIPAKLLDTFCWIHHTFSVADAWEKKVGEEVPYPGVDTVTEDDKKVYHSYYQWVFFVLFLQAIAFYAPRYLWRSVEGHKVKNLVSCLKVPILPEKTRVAQKNLLVEYLASNINRHKIYFSVFFLAETLNFVNVVCQMRITDIFFDGAFSTYGIEVLKFTEWDAGVRFDPMIKLFPRLAKCIFHRYGPSGDVQKHDAMCILPVNVINEKIYIFLWFWFVTLVILSGIVLAYRVSIVMSPRLRLLVISLRGHLARKSHLEIVLKQGNLSDWLLLYLLSKNLDPINFRDVVRDLARRIERKITINDTSV